MAFDLGIDLGTTRTVVAYADRGNYPVVSFTDADGDAHEFFPSVVALTDQGLVHGFDAQAAVREGAPHLRSVKRALSSPTVTAQTRVELGDVSFPVLDVVTSFLGALRRALVGSSTLTGHDPLAEGGRTVVAVPAHAYGAQRLLTLEAFRAAGFQVTAMVNEPSAAGFEYTHRKSSTLTSRRSRVVVYDLGGGTFDASLVNVEGTAHNVLGSLGINNLGGDDVDLVLAELVLERAGIREEDLSHTETDELLDQCRDAKERLAPQSRRVVVELRGQDIVLPVDEVYEACAPLVDRTLESMDPLMGRLEDGAPDLTDIAGVYLVGGASGLPLVPRKLRERFGRRVHRSPYPGASTAIGLAIAADPGAGYSLTDRLSRGFGVFREQDGGARMSFDPILTEDHEFSSAGTVEIRRDYWAAHNVGWFRFVECAGVDEHGEPRGELAPYHEIVFPFDPAMRGVEDLTEVHVAHSEAWPHIEERYSVDPHGIVEVTITDLGDGYSRSYVLGERTR